MSLQQGSSILSRHYEDKQFDMLVLDVFNIEKLDQIFRNFRDYFCG